jgi:deoxycitidine kinase
MGNIVSRRNRAKAPPTVIFIEGNVGSGKSTLCAAVQEIAGTEFPHLLIRTVLEPVDQWTSLCDAEGNNLLQLFYKDPVRWGFVFQTYVQHTRTQAIEHAMKLAVDDGVDILLFERSPISDQVFVKSAMQNGSLTDIEVDVYNLLRKDVFHDAAHEDLARFVYLRESPTTCLARVKSRGRRGESVVDIEYLTDLHNRHDRLFLCTWSITRRLLCTCSQQSPHTSARRVLTAAVCFRISETRTNKHHLASYFPNTPCTEWFL